MNRKCKSCGSTRLTWFAQNYTTSGVQDGRLRMSEVQTRFVMGCDECSDTLGSMTADEVIKATEQFIATILSQENQLVTVRGEVATHAARVHKRNDAIRALVAIIDEELMPNVAKIAVRDYQRLNETLIAARKLIGH